VVVPAVVVLRERALGVDGPAELAAPDDQRLVEQAAPLEVRDEGGGGLVGVLALVAELLGQFAVLVPAPVQHLHDPHAALDETAGQ
jgi:hypothetical protein